MIKENGIPIGLTDGRYLKLDQTTPQTVTGGIPTFTGIKNNGDLTFTNSNSRTITIEDITTARFLTVKAPNGVTGIGGGVLNLNGGNGANSTGSSGTNGGATIITGGNGGANGISSFIAGSGNGANATMAGGIGGELKFRSSALTPSVGTGGNIFLTGGAGGRCDNLDTIGVPPLAAGTGGLINITSGAGGAGYFGVVKGGNGGSITVASGAGAGLSGPTASGTNTGGNGGDYTFTSGAGGLAGSAPVNNIGGNSGKFTFTSGNGGNIGGSTLPATGGSSGNFEFSTGNGGFSSGIVGTSGNSGSMYFYNGQVNISSSINGIRGSIFLGASSTGGIGGKISVYTTAIPTAYMMIGAGTATAGTAPIKLTSGTLMTTPEAGAIEYLTDTFYMRGTDKLSVTQLKTPVIKTDFTTPTDLTITTGAAKTLTLGTVVWGDIDFPILIRTTGANIPTLATFNGNLTMPQWAVNDFNMCESQEFIHEWKEGSDCSWHIHLTTNGLDATDRYVKFELEYAYSVNGVWTFPAVFTTADILIPASTADKTQIIMPITSFTPTGAKIADHCVARLKRVLATGTAPTNNPWIPMLQMHIQKDTIGSRQMTTK